MPELIEVELYRQAAEATVGRTITGVDAPDPWFLKRGASAAAVSALLVGAEVTAVRRTGKVLFVDTDAVTLGLRFGMTGRLLVDQHSPIGKLEYSSDRDEPSWDRFVVRFAAGDLRIRDPRRLGGVELDPDEERLGVDAAALTPATLAAALAGSRVPLKARLLDQRRVAGLGNLLCDEILWRAGLDPRREATSLSPAERRRLLYHVRRVLADLSARGGSHTGDLHAERHPGGRCPRDGEDLARLTIGGRTTYACTRHQLERGRTR